MYIVSLGTHFKSAGMPSTTITTDVKRLKEKLRVLEVYNNMTNSQSCCFHLQKLHTSLQRRVAEEANELNSLKRLASSADVLSTSKATPPECSHSFLPPHGPHARSPFSPVPQVTKREPSQGPPTGHGGSLFYPNLETTKVKTPVSYMLWGTCC